MPSFALITPAKQHDRTVAGRFNLKPGSIVAFDRTYKDYSLFSSWTGAGIFFVTRQKKNAVYEIVEKRRPALHRFIFSGEIIRLTGPQAEKNVLIPYGELSCGTEKIIEKLYCSPTISTLGPVLSRQSTRTDGR